MAKLSDTVKATAKEDPGQQGELASAETKVAVQKATAKAAPKAKEEPKDGPPPPALLEDDDEYVNALYYGREGSAKTTNALFAANLGVTLLVNAEGGAKVRALRKMGIDVKNIRVRPNTKAGEVLSFEMLDELYWQVKAQIEDGDPEAPFCIVWDSVTEIHQKLLRDIVAGAVVKAESKKQDRDPFFTDRADYGVMTDQMRQLLKRFRDLPCHFVMTALERRDEDDDGKVYYGPAVTPALMTDVLGWTDLNCHTTVKDVGGEVTYTGVFTDVGKYRAKDRWHAMPAELVDPQFHRVLAYITEELTAEDDPIQLGARARRDAARAARAAGDGKKKGAAKDDDE